MDSMTVWLVYKLTSTAIGLFCFWIAYKLSIRHKKSPHSDLSGQMGEHIRLNIKRATPGILFALAGFGIISMNIWTGTYSDGKVILKSTLSASQNLGLQIDQPGRKIGIDASKNQSHERPLAQEAKSNK